MSRKIIGVTVGTQLPKPNFKQTDPTKGDYIKNKPDFEGLKNQVNSVSDLVGDTKVSDQIADAISKIDIPDEIYVQPDEPLDAPDGTVWIDLDAEGHEEPEVIIDTSLTQAGQAADAKAVGDALAQAAFIGEDLNEDIIVDGKGEFTSPYAGTIHRFSVEINCAPLYIPEDNLGPEFNDDYQPYTDYGVLIFPDSYTDKGKKTRLVISAHGGGGTVTADSSQAEYQSISRYLVANGYAVMDVNGLPEQYAIDKGNLRLQDSVGSYLAIQSHIKAYNYCMENFNFYPEVFLVGISEGGITTTNIVLHSHIPVLAQAGWSPVLDTYNQIWMDPWPWCSVNGPGAVLATVYGFDPIPDATSTKDRLKWTYDEKKIMGYNPMKCNVTTGSDGLEYRHYRCPVKFWHCMDDDTVRYEPTEAFIKSIQNAGGTAYLKLYETGGHETAYVGDPVPNPIGNTIAYDGTEIEIKPVCEETFLFFKRFE